jgi:tRNA(fMet)-specific endonuclease VapC
VFLLDTDHFVIIQDRTEPQYSSLRRHMDRYTAHDFHVSIISFHEQVTGWNAYLNRARSADGVVRAYAMFEDVLWYFTQFPLLSFDARAASEFDSLRRRRVRIGTMDLRIAAIALTQDYTVLTRNLVDFQKVPGLKVEDWTTD